jgi:HK97 family phage prohead protease
MNGLELRIEDGGNGKLTLEGYASRTEIAYQVGSFQETIKRGAFRRSLAEQPDTSLLVNHEGLPLARTTSGNLDLSEDSNGLRVRASLEREDPDVRAIEYKMRRGDLSEMSIGFRATGQSWNEDRTERTISEVSLHRGDVSIVSSAASPTSTAMLRSSVTLEQRKALAARIGDRVCGPWGYVYEEPAGPLTVARSDTALLVARGYHSLAKANRAKLRRPGEPPTKAKRYSVERARFRQMMARAHPGSDAHTEGDPHPYSDAEVAALGEKGPALKRKGNRGWHYPIVNRRDLLAAIAAYGSALPSERAEVKAWIKKRAITMGLDRLLPKSWYTPPVKLEEGEPPNPSETSTVGGQP